MSYQKFINSGMARSVKSASQRGFTLIEMAIVLVIIGLIVGGVIKGQEVVNNGRIKIQVAQIDGVKSAVYSFQDKFGFYPGDFEAAAVFGTSATCDGNETGLIGGATPGGAGTTASTPVVDTAAAGTQMNCVWYQLYAAGLISNVENTANPTAAFYPGKIPNTYLYFGDFTAGATGTTTTGKMVRIQGNVSSGAAASGALRTPDALSIDQKYDDGLPYTGAILSSTTNTAGCTSGTVLASTYSIGATTATGAGIQATPCTLFWLF